MKTRFFTAVALTCMVAHSSPFVSDVEMTQDHSTRKVTIRYNLSGEAAVVTVDIQTNALADASSGWVSIGAENLCGFVGDVNRKISPGEDTRKIYWNPDTYWPGHELPEKKVRAVVTAWRTNAPPDWLVCQMTEPYDVTYYQHACQVPDGVKAKKYKRTHMLFRKIPAKGVVWTMGAGSTKASERPHQVSLTEDYYMSVYELTLAQVGAAAFDALEGSVPHNNRTYVKLRGAVKGAQWPTFKSDGTLDFWESHAVDDNSTIASLRKKCGLLFDLPTEAQWEYAARAGVTAATFGDGTDTEANISQFGRFSSDKNEPDCEGYSAGLASVGSYQPNSFGLYDVIGNVFEVCLDWYISFEDIDTGKVHIDPVGGMQGTARVHKGGCYYYDNGGLLSSRSSQSPDTTWNAIGFRLCVPMH